MLGFVLALAFGAGVLGLGCAAPMPKHALREPPASEVERWSVEQLIEDTSYREVVHTLNDPSISCESLMDLHMTYTDILFEVTTWYNKRSRQEPSIVALETSSNRAAAFVMYGEEWKDDPDPKELYSWIGPRRLREIVAALKGVLAIGFHVLGQDCGVDAVLLEAATYGDSEAIQQLVDD